MAKHLQVSGTPANGQVPVYNSTSGIAAWAAPSAGATDATTTAKGIVQLAGDLGGTAAAPTVPGLAAKAPSASPTFTGTVVINGANGDLQMSANTDGGEFNLFSDANGKLTIYGSGANTLHLNLLDGALYIASTLILSNARVMSNVDFTGTGNTWPTFNQNTTGSAAKLTTARTINGVSFDGSANITVPVGDTLPTQTGNSGKFLTTNGTTTSWGTPAGSGGGIVRSVSTISANTSAGAVALTDYVYICTGSTGYTLTLPTAVGNTNLYTAKNGSTANQTVATTSSQTIDGSTTVTLTPNTSLSFISDGTNWQIV